MGRLKALAVGLALLAALLIPGTTSATPGGRTIVVGFPCSPHGSGLNGVNTNLSTAILYTDPANDTLACQFNLSLGASPNSLSSTTYEFGGPCYYQNQNTGITFAQRVYRVHGNQASLYCWEGSEETD